MHTPLFLFYLFLVKIFLKDIYLAKLNPDHTFNMFY